MEGKIERRRRLVDQDPNNTEWQRNLAVNHGRIAEVLNARGRLRSALGCFRVGLQILEQQTRMYPDNVIWRQDLARTHQGLVGLLEALGDQADDAWPHSSRKRRLADRPGEEPPGNGSAARACGTSLG